MVFRRVTYSRSISVAYPRFITGGWAMENINKYNKDDLYRSIVLITFNILFYTIKGIHTL